ncbi:MAG TPA: hypothetical protein VFX63_10355 [Pyrinomonadaceae bacterium]|nr:hypothetical protein [Pyrinomonadaceae bacterium]
MFSELSLEDQTCAPRFENLWLRAGANRPAPASLVTRLVLVTTVVIVVMSFVAVRSWLSSSQSQQVANIPAQIIPITAGPRVQHSELAAASKVVARPRRLARRQTERTAITQAAMLSNWQSPTNVLLNSPTVSVLSSLPQLDQSARDLEQFLPKKNNELIKESKQ